MTLTQRDYQCFEEGTGFGDWCGNLLLKVFPDSFNTEDIVDVSFDPAVFESHASPHDPGHFDS